MQQIARAHEREHSADTLALNMRHGVCGGCSRRGLISNDTHRCLPGPKENLARKNARVATCERKQSSKLEIRERTRTERGKRPRAIPFGARVTGPFEPHARSATLLGTTAIA